MKPNSSKLTNPSFSECFQDSNHRIIDEIMVILGLPAIASFAACAITIVTTTAGDTAAILAGGC